MDIIASLYTIRIISSISFSSVSVSTPKGLLACSIQCQSGCVAFTYNKATSDCKLVSEFYTGTPLTSPTKFYMKNINCPLLDKYKYITSGTNKACVKFYLANTITKNWPQAQTFCQANGEDLIQLVTTEKSNMIIQYITERFGSDGQWWIGFRDKDMNNVYRWINDEVLYHDDPRWLTNEPSFTSFVTDIDDCGVLRWEKFWDYNCYNPRLNFTCEKTM